MKVVVEFRKVRSGQPDRGFGLGGVDRGRSPETFLEHRVDHRGDRVDWDGVHHHLRRQRRREMVRARARVA